MSCGDTHLSAGNAWLGRTYRVRSWPCRRTRHRTGVPSAKRLPPSIRTPDRRLYAIILHTAVLLYAVIHTYIRVYKCPTSSRSYTPYYCCTGSTPISAARSPIASIRSAHSNPKVRKCTARRSRSAHNNSGPCLISSPPPSLIGMGDGSQDATLGVWHSLG